MAKGIASGYPLSAVVSRKEIMCSQPPGSMGSTYAGYTVTCVAAKVTLKALDDEDLLNNCNVCSEQLFSGLKSKLPEKFPAGITCDICGKGLIIVIELIGAPHGFANSAISEALKRDTIIVPAFIYETLCLIPPLNIAKEKTNLAIECITASVTAAVENLKQV